MQSNLVFTALCCVCILLSSYVVKADNQPSWSDNNIEPTIENLYAYPLGKTKSEVVLFYNSTVPCENCSKAITETKNLIADKYPEQFEFYTINLAQYPAFKNFFNLFSPLSLVLIKIEDGASLGYKKMENIQYKIEEPITYQQQIDEFINNFLIWS